MDELAAISASPADALLVLYSLQQLLKSAPLQIEKMCLQVVDSLLKSHHVSALTAAARHRRRCVSPAQFDDAAVCLWVFARGLQLAPIGSATSSSRKSGALTTSSTANQSVPSTPSKPGAQGSNSSSIRSTFLRDTEGASARSVAAAAMQSLEKHVAGRGSVPAAELALVRRGAVAAFHILAACADGSGMSALMPGLLSIMQADIAASDTAAQASTDLTAACASVAATCAAAQACLQAALGHFEAFASAEEAALSVTGSKASQQAAGGVSSAFRLTTRALSLLRSAVPSGFKIPAGSSPAADQLWTSHALQLGNTVEALHKTLAFWEARPLVAVGLWSPADYLQWCSSSSPAPGAPSSPPSPPLADDTAGSKALMAALATPAPPTTVRERYAWPSAAAPPVPPSSAAPPRGANSTTATPARHRASSAATPAGGRRRHAPKTPAALKRATSSTAAAAAPTAAAGPTAASLAKGGGAAGKGGGDNWWSLLEKGFFLCLEQHAAARAAIGLSVSKAALPRGGVSWPEHLGVLVDAVAPLDKENVLLDDGLPAARVAGTLHAAVGGETDRCRRQLLVNESESGIGAALSRLIRMRLCAGEHVSCLFAGDDVEGGRRGREAPPSKADETVHHMKKGLQYLLGAAASAAMVGGASGYDCACTIATAAHNVSSTLYNNDLFQQASVPMAVAAYALRLSVTSALAVEGPLACHGEGGVAAVPPAAAAALKRHAVSAQYAQLASCLHKALLDSGDIPAPGTKASVALQRVVVGAENAAAAALVWRALELVLSGKQPPSSGGGGGKGGFGNSATKLARIASDAALYHDTLPVTLPASHAVRLASVVSKIATALPGAVDDVTMSRLVMSSALSGLAPVLQGGALQHDDTGSVLCGVPAMLGRLSACLHTAAPPAVSADTALTAVQGAIADAALGQVQRSAKALGLWQLSHASLQKLHKQLTKGGEGGGKLSSLLQSACESAVQDGTVAQCLLFHRLCGSLDQPRAAAQSVQVLWLTCTRLLDQCFPRGGGLIPQLLKALAGKQLAQSSDHSDSTALAAATTAGEDALDCVEPAAAPLDALTSLQALVCAPAALLPATAAVATGESDAGNGAARVSSFPPAATLLLPRLHAAAGLASVGHWDGTALRSAGTLQGACVSALQALAATPAAQATAGVHMLSICCGDAIASSTVASVACAGLPKLQAPAAVRAASDDVTIPEQRLQQAVVTFEAAVEGCMEASDAAAQAAVLHAASAVHATLHWALARGASVSYMAQVATGLLTLTAQCSDDIVSQWQLSSALLPVALLSILCMMRPSPLVPDDAVKLVAQRAETVLATVHDAAHRAVPMSSSGESPVRRIQFDLGADEADSPVAPLQPSEGGGGRVGKAPIENDEHTARKLFDMVDVASNDLDDAAPAGGAALTPPREGVRFASPGAGDSEGDECTPGANTRLFDDDAECDNGTPLAEGGAGGLGKRLRFADTGAGKAAKGGVRFAESPAPAVSTASLDRDVAMQCLPVVEALADTLQCVIERIDSDAPACVTCEVEAVKLAMVWGGVHNPKGRALDVLGGGEAGRALTCVLFAPLMPSLFLYRALLGAARACACADNPPLAQQYVQRALQVARTLPGKVATRDGMHALLSLHAWRGLPSLPSASAAPGDTAASARAAASAHFHTGHAAPAWDAARASLKMTLQQTQDAHECAALLRTVVPVALAAQLHMRAAGGAGCLPKRATAAAASALLPLGAVAAELEALCISLDCTPACGLSSLEAALRRQSVLSVGCAADRVSPVLHPATVAVQTLLELTEQRGVDAAWDAEGGQHMCCAAEVESIRSAAAQCSGHEACPGGPVHYAGTGGNGAAAVAIPAASAALRLELAAALQCGDAVAAAHIARVLALLVGASSPGAAEETRALLAMAAGHALDAFVLKCRAKRLVAADADWLQQVESWAQDVASPFEVCWDDSSVGVRFKWSHSDTRVPMLQLVSTHDGSAVMSALVRRDGSMPPPKLLRLPPPHPPLDTEATGHNAGCLTRQYRACMPHGSPSTCAVPHALARLAAVLHRSTQSVLQAGITSAAAAEAAKWSASKRNQWWKQRVAIDGDLQLLVADFVGPLVDAMGGLDCLLDCLPASPVSTTVAAGDTTAKAAAAAGSPSTSSCPPPCRRSEAELSSLKVVDLKAELRDLGLSVSGRKAELVQRLLDAEEAAATVQMQDAAPAADAAPTSADSGAAGPRLLQLMLCPMLQHLPLEIALGGEQGVILSRVPCAALLAPAESIAPASACVLRGAFCVNPGGDLPQTASTLQAPIEALQAAGGDSDWQGTSGALSEHPSGTHLRLLSGTDVFLYAGHGAGEAYTPHQTVASTLRDPCTTAVLFGCSSGKLRVQGVGGAHGAPVGLLIAGTASVAGNLWDVTGGDEDRMAVQVLERWLALAQGSASQTLGQSVLEGGKACKLPALTAGAMVVYGQQAIMRGL